MAQFKHVALACLIFSCMTGIVQAKEKQVIILTSEIIKIIDGFPWGVDANKIKLMLQVRHEVQKIQYGNSEKNGTFTGHYIFEGKRYGVRELALLESKLEADYYQKLATFSDKEKSKQEIATLTQNYHQTKSKLHAALLQAKKEFNEKVAPFTKSARGAKEQMLILIQEFAAKSKRDDCFLLRWADADEENEMVAFNEQIVTFKTLDQFCTDLVNYLESMMASCKKAWAQFKKMMEDLPTHQAGAK